MSLPPALRAALCIVLLAVCTAALGLSTAFAAAQPPGIEWRTFETSHFYLHFEKRNEAQARRLAAIVEPVHALLTRNIKWVPEEKTHVLLTDFYDLSNGSAQVTPYSQIEIYASAPGPDSQLGDYDDWLRLVFTHEYTHILHLDQAAGPAKIVRDILGRDFLASVGGLPVPIAPFPNYLIPQWMIEGYATESETEHTTAGRGDSSFTAMLLRMDALEGRFWPLDKGSGDEGEWPGGAFRYLYGQAFQHYLSEKYGASRLHGMYAKNSWGLTPFLIDIPAQLTIGSSIETEWENWQRKVTYNAQVLRDKLSQEGLGAPEPLIPGGWETRYPRLSPDQKTVYFSVTNNYSYPRVEALDLETGDTRTLFERNDNLSPVSPDRAGKYLYFTQLEFHQKFRVYADMYRYDLEQDEIERMTHGERLLSVDVSPDGKHVTAVRNQRGNNELRLYRIEGQAAVFERKLWGSAESAVDAPRFSPDGSQITFSAWSRGGFTDIYVVDLQGETKRLTSDRYLDVAPVFSTDGKSVIFSSDRSGIYNLYSIGLDGGHPQKRTNVIGGLFENDPLDAEQTITAAYKANGYTVARIKLAPNAITTGTNMPARPAYIASTKPYPGESHPYSPATSLWPRAWAPILNLSVFPGEKSGQAQSFETGLATQGSDVLGIHSYGASVFYERRLQRPGFAANYVYDGATPTYHFQASDFVQESALRATKEFDRNKLSGVRSQGGAITVSLPFPHYRFRYDLAAAYAFTVDREFGRLLHAGGPVVRRRSSGIVQAVYNSSRQYGIGIGRQNGSLAGITTRITTKSIGANYEELLALGDARQYFSLPYRQSIALQAQGGIASTTEFEGPFYLGGIDPRLSPGEVGVLPLRGFLPDTQEGRKLLKASAEYRFPLGLIKRGLPVWGTFPFLADQLHGDLFVEGGSAWNSGAPHFLASGGAEIKFDFTLGYGMFQPVTFGLGVAAPLYPQSAANGVSVYILLQVGNTAF